MKKLYRDSNYLIIDDGVNLILALPATASIYSHASIGEDRQEPGFLISGINGIRYTITEAEITAGDWEDDASLVYTVQSMIDFLRTNTGY